jgi:NADH-quinone oxidoreductase subunit L
VPLMALALGALAAGFVFAPYFVEEHYAHFWRTALFTLPDNSILAESHATEGHGIQAILIKWLPTLMMLGGFVLAYISYIAAPSIPAWTVRTFKPIHAFLYNKWYFDELYDFIFVRPVRFIARILWVYGDGALIDGLGPDGISAWVVTVAKRAVRLQTGYVYQYAFVMLAGVAVIVTYFAYLFREALFKL